jgi:hypothetical protein
MMLDECDAVLLKKSAAAIEQLQDKPLLPGTSRNKQGANKRPRGAL